jgi:hypothetical protein
VFCVLPSFCEVVFHLGFFKGCVFCKLVQSVVTLKVVTERKVDFCHVFKQYEQQLGCIQLPPANSATAKQAFKDLLREHVVFNGAHLFGDSKIEMLVCTVLTTHCTHHTLHSPYTALTIHCTHHTLHSGGLNEGIYSDIQVLR